jgi:hypothetical protein
MRVFALIGLIAIVGGRVAAWLLKRWRPQLSDSIRVSTMIFTQGVVAIIVGAIAVRLPQDGDPVRLALGILLGLLALGSAALGGLYAWAWLKYGAAGERADGGH